MRKASQNIEVITWRAWGTHALHTPSLQNIKGCLWQRNANSCNVDVLCFTMEVENDNPNMAGQEFEGATDECGSIADGEETANAGGKWGSEPGKLKPRHFTRNYNSPAVVLTHDGSLAMSQPGGYLFYLKEDSNFH